MINDALRNPKAARALYAILDREERALPPKPRKVPTDIETELRSLVGDLFRLFVREIQDCFEAGLIEHGPDDQWKISPWVRQAASSRPPALQ